MPHVPAGTNRKTLAQQLANCLRMVTRSSTGERYASAAEVFLIASGLELQAADQEVPNLLVHGWSERPWQQDDEWRLVISDFLEAVNTWFLKAFPVTTQAPFCMPVVAKVSEGLVRISEFAAHTSSPLPSGWAEQIAWHGALLPIGPTT
jgi:hypothetical protein